MLTSKGLYITLWVSLMAARLANPLHDRANVHCRHKSSVSSLTLQLLLHLKTPICWPSCPVSPHMFPFRILAAVKKKWLKDVHKKCSRNATNSSKIQVTSGIHVMYFHNKRFVGNAIPARLNKKRSADDKLTLSEFDELRTHLYDCALR